MSDESKMDMECICPSCGIRAALEKAKRCIELQCPSCGASMTNLKDKVRQPSGSNVPSP